jgi:para-nitrobenzyl esterase
MADYWTDFAKSGNPNGANLPTWLPYEVQHERALELGDEIRMIDYPNLVQIRILDELFANYM